MNVIDCVQGSPDWLAARAGVVTASCADKVMQPTKLEPVEGDGYLSQIVAEILLGCPVDVESTGWMERGSEMEATARAWYEFERGVVCDPVGLILRDDGRVGASPDSLVGEDGGVEIKCPGAKQHVANLINPKRFEKDHRGQVQVAMLITGRAWWDLVSFNPKMPNVLIRCEPETAWRSKWGSALGVFLARVDKALADIGPVEMPRARKVRDPMNMADLYAPKETP